jgi:hypothetical protein
MRHTGRQILRMMRRNNKAVSTFHQSLQETFHHRTLPWIESRQRLVEQQDTRIAGECTSDQGTAQLAVG